uniref:Transposase n=1 Tax=Globodera pallida TaxID=36090 RepID=A0A183BUX2_GLOPA
MQECHPSYGIDGDMAAKRLLEEKKLTLSRRFQLIERGYVLKLKNNRRGARKRRCRSVAKARLRLRVLIAEAGVDIFLQNCS